MQREFLEAQGLTPEVIDAVIAEHDRVVQQLQVQHAQAVADVRFTGVLDNAIAAAGGRSAKAIAALLDVESLKGSDDPKAAIDQAITALKKDSGYLFAGPGQAPYAPGTGTGAFAPEAPQTLAGALKEKFRR